MSASVDSDDDENFNFNAAELLNLGEPDPLPSGGSSAALPPVTLVSSRSAPTLKGATTTSTTATSGAPSSSRASFAPSSDSASSSSSSSSSSSTPLQNEAGKTSVRHTRKSVGKRALTLGGKVRGEGSKSDGSGNGSAGAAAADSGNGNGSNVESIPSLLAHLERNFSNSLMLTNRSLDALVDAFGKHKGKGNLPPAVALSRQLVFHLSEVNVVITRVTSLCDGKTKIASEALIPETVDEALTSSKHLLSVLLPKYNKMTVASKAVDASDKIEEGLLEQIDEAMSDASEQMDALGGWLKEGGFTESAGAVMLAMKWKVKAFGKKSDGSGTSGAGGGAGSNDPNDPTKNRKRFGSIRIAPGGTFGDETASATATAMGALAASAAAAGATAGDSTKETTAMKDDKAAGALISSMASALNEIALMEEDEDKDE